MFRSGGVQSAHDEIFKICSSNTIFKAKIVQYNMFFLWKFLKKSYNEHPYNKMTFSTLHFYQI